MLTSPPSALGNATGAVDEEFVRRAIDQCDLNALRMAVFQATGDPELAAIQLERPIDGSGANGSTLIVRVGADDIPALKEKAVRFLLNPPLGFVPTVPSDAELRRMMELLRDETLDDETFRYGKDAAAFDEFPRAVAWSDGRPELPPGFEVAVIGTGISGIAAGVQLQRLGIPYTIYERRSEVGGTWSINTYPDARVDTTNFMYQFGFEKNYPWTEYFARQDEVWRYLSHVAEKYGLLPNIRFGADVTSAVFDEMTASWRLMVSDDEGRTEEIEANAIISGSGLFGTPRELEIDGVEGFRGSIIHTTQWDGDQDIDGKRVAVIGNGSTGVQLLGAIAERAEHVTVFQRTPQWISGRDRYGEQLSPETRWLLDTMPYYWNWYIYSILAEANGSQVLQEPDSEWQAQGGLVSEANDNFRALLTEYIRSNLPGRPDLVEKVTPRHAPMARRLIVDNGWYTALLRDNVELVTEGIEGLTPDGVRTVDGVERPIDVIVAAVGFSTTKYLHPTEYRGVGGTTLEQRWSESQGPRAHLGIAVPGFPNLFIMYGPNSQPRSGSLVSFVEAWAAYAAKSIVVMLERGHRRMEVRQEVFDDYNARLDKHSLELIWMDPGSLNRNYYVNEHGRSQVNEPWRVEQYYSWVIEPDPDEFDFV